MICIDIPKQRDDLWREELHGDGRPFLSGGFFGLHVHRPSPALQLTNENLVLGSFSESGDASWAGQMRNISTIATDKRIMCWGSVQ